MSRQCPDGVCRICRAKGPLSFEHVPPKAAFNRVPVVRSTMEDYLKAGGNWDVIKGRMSQRGAGECTLCERCNNRTGGWYGSEYAEWAKLGLEWLARIPPEIPPVEVTIQNRYPMRFLKQVITMLFSVNAAGFADDHAELVAFVLDPRKTNLPPIYQLYMTVVAGPRSRSSGLSSMSFDRGVIELVTEVAHLPFAFLMVVGEPRRDDLGCITHFADLGYDDRREVRIRVKAGEIFTIYPDDHRTRDRAEREAQASR
jgi:hypothetical protein